MKFAPKSEEEINAANLLPAGDYDFEIQEAEEQTSKAGNDMVKLTLNIEGDEGRRHLVFDYLVGSEASMYKVRAFAVAVGLLPQYERGEMQAVQMFGRTGKARIEVDHRDKNYPAKNVVKGYHKPGATSAPAKANGAKANDFVDDSIPF